MSKYCSKCGSRIKEAKKLTDHEIDVLVDELYNILEQEDISSKVEALKELERKHEELDKGDIDEIGEVWYNIIEGDEGDVLKTSLKKANETQVGDIIQVYQYITNKMVEVKVIKPPIIAGDDMVEVAIQFSNEDEHYAFWDEKANRWEVGEN